MLALMFKLSKEYMSLLSRIKNTLKVFFILNKIPSHEFDYVFSTDRAINKWTYDMLYILNKKPQGQFEVLLEHCFKVAEAVNNNKKEYAIERLAQLSALSIQMMDKLSTEIHDERSAT